MAVNLKATATLNGKPYLGTLKELSSATANLNKSALKDNKEVNKSLDEQITKRETASKAVTAGAQSVNRATQQTTKIMRQGKVSIDDYNKSLGQVQGMSNRIVQSYSTMTPAAARHATAINELGRANAALAKQMAAGLEGPALERYQKAVDTAARNVGRARKAIIDADVKAYDALNTAAERSAAMQIAQQNRIGNATDANMQKVVTDFHRRTALSEKAAATEIKNQNRIGNALDANMARVAADFRKRAAVTADAAAKQAAYTNAVDAGNAKARAYTATLGGMTQEQMKLAAASERLGAAEGRLASAMARSNGVITPAVQSARAGVIAAQAAYNGLAEAQANVGRTGPQAASGLAAQRYLYHDVSRQALGLGVALGALPAAAVAVGAVWENQFANVIRTSDYAVRNSETRINALRTSMVNMAKTMPMSFGAITEIATLGNQMGVQAHELDGFTKSVAMFSATSGIAVEEAATAFGRLRTVASDANFSYMGVADSILKVGVNSVATEQEIINVTTQISSIAASAGFSTQEMIGLSGALASVRVPPELSRSIITRTFGQFDKAVQKNGIELKTLARVSGRSVEDIKKNWGGPGAADIFTDFTEGLRKSGRQAREELQSLGITSVRDVPALMRLANAADSNGKKGGLLTQTIADAKNASGEVQSQYAIMAETVVGRLKVLGNSVLSFFNSLGSSSNGFVKGAIDGLTNMFQFLDKIVDNPFSSWALGAMAAASGIALATSGLAKLTAGMKMFQHVSAVAGGASFLSAIGMSKKGGGVGELAQMSPLLLGTASAVNSFARGAKAAGSAWKNTGKTIVSTATGAFASFAHHIGRAEIGNKAMNKSLSTMAGTTPKVQGALANMVKFGLHPVTLGLGAIATVGAIAYNNWANGFYKASTSSEALAGNLSKIDMTSVSDVSKVLKTINIDGRELRRWGTQGVNPFKGGMPELMGNIELLADYKSEMAAVDKMHSRYKKNIRSSIERRYTGMGFDGKATEAGLKNLDGAFKEMRAAGNDAGVTAFWSQISKNAGSSATSADRMRTLLKDMPEEAAALTNQFAMQDMSLEQGLKNFGKLSRQMRDTAAEFDGTSVIADTFGLGDQEAATFGKVLNEAAAAFIDYSAALEAGTKVNEDGVFQNFDLTDFNSSLNESIQGQETWMAGVRRLSRETSADVIQEIGKMGPAGKELVNELVAGLDQPEGSPGRVLAEETLRNMERAFATGAPDFASNLAEQNNVMNKAIAMLGEEAGNTLNGKLAASLKPEEWTELSTGLDAVIDNHGPELGGRLGKRLFENLDAGNINIDQFSTLGEAFGAIGYNASKALLNALDSGISMDQIMARIERIQAPRIPVEFEPGSDADTKITGAFKDMFGANGVEIPANFNLDMTMESLREALNMTGRDGTSRLLPDIEADLTLNDIIAEGQYNGFRAWALAQGIDVEILANPMAAQLTLDAYTAVANGTVAMTQLETIDMASGKLYEFVDTAAGTTAIVEIDGDTNIATGKVWELDASVESAKAKPVDADTDVAVAAIKEVDAMAEAAKTKSIDVTDNGTADAVQQKINGITGKTVTVTVNEVQGSKVKQANGSVLQFYANGGVRENHVAQIAPAGAMRVWAEPETGGEAYIPLAQSKRARSEAILDDVASRFGFSLQPQNYTKYADGGHYMAQAMSRQRVAAPTSRGVGGDSKVNIGAVNFGQGNQTDQFREFSRHMNRIARGL